MTNPNEPAFPTEKYVQEWTHPSGDLYRDTKVRFPGLTIRQEFSKAAMQGILAVHGFSESPEIVGEESVKYADALIAALNKEKT